MTLLFATKKKQNQGEISGKRYILAYSTLCSYLNKLAFENKNPINDSMNLITTQIKKYLWKIQRFHLR